MAEIVASGKFVKGGKDRMTVKLDDRGRITYTGDGPKDWINTVAEEFGDFIVWSGQESGHLLPVRAATFDPFLHAVCTVANRNTDEGWSYRVDGPRVEHGSLVGFPRGEVAPT